jgi:hypothetical protein
VSLHKPSIERILEVLDEGYLHLLQGLAEEAESLGLEADQVSLSLIDENDKFVPGTWVPEVWLVVRKIHEH